MVFGAVQLFWSVILDAKDDTEAENELIAPGDTINLNKEDELNKRNTSALKKRSKRSNNGDDKENEKEVKGTKRKQLKKSCKGCT